jgi:D-alanyl-D-alanine carboxypeptidase/D-alanyl-D-alanine carboxypeptidase (penicillin-binding protein 5/6)
MRKKILCSALIFILLCGMAPWPAAREDYLALSAKSAVLMCADSGQVLFAHNAHTRLPVASTTKIMTALLLLEAGEPDISFAATEQMVRVEGTSMGLRAGDSVSRYALAVGMLMASGNDAANATAIHLAGSVPAFTAIMNARARGIGMTNTNFVTPSGLDAEGHFSTAYDMALLGAEAIRNPLFREISSQAAVRVSFGNLPHLRTLRNHHRLVREMPECIGIKTGFTRRAGRTLVTAVQRNGRTLIAVTLNAPQDWQDHRRLFEYGFAQYVPVELDLTNSVVAKLPITGGLLNHANVTLSHAPTAFVRTRPAHLHRVLLLRPFEYAPIEAGRVVGTARYYDGDMFLAEAPLVVQNTVGISRPSRSDRQPGLRMRIRRLFRR